MAKKAQLDIANDPIENLMAYLGKLKKDEAKLEIALTLREFPETEEMLVRLTTCVVELGIVERSMRLESTKSSEEELKAKQQQVQAQIDFLKARMLTLRDDDASKKLREYYTGCISNLEVARYSAGMTKKNLKFLEHYEAMLRKLRQLYNQFKLVPFPAAFDEFYHICHLKKYLEIADDLVARKGAV